MILSPGIVDAGFKGHLKIAVYNSGTESIEAEKADHVIAPIHLIFLKTDGHVGFSFGERIDEILG